MNSKKLQRPYGLWRSPLTPLSMASGVNFYGLECDQDGTLIWLESHGERGALVVQPGDGQAAYELNSQLSVRARVGYGGGDFSVHQGLVYFVEAVSGRIYRQALDAGQAEPITPAFGRSAAPSASPDGRWLVFVHSYEGQDCLAVIDTAGHFWPQKLAGGADFYMQPAWNPDSRLLAWIDWNHPNMPWDGTFLRLAEIYTGDGLPVVNKIETIAGGPETSIFQPQFSADGRYLAYVSDASGWWQIYCYDLHSGEHRQLTSCEAEHGIPAWVQGLRTYTFSPDSKKIYFLRNQASLSSLWQLNLAEKVEQRIVIDQNYTALDQVCAIPGGLALIASGATVPMRVITHTSGKSNVTILQRSDDNKIPVKACSAPEPLAWPAEGGGQVFGLFYKPTNPRYECSGKPPLVVKVHGGPTGQARNDFNPQAQFFTSRGYAFLEVNFRGSSGYGREYRNRLRGQWGHIDVQDTVSGARYLVEQDAVDHDRMVIMGSSAGGLTLVLAMEQYPGFFKAGICAYGVLNLLNLAEETHKFEAHYLDRLIGPLPETIQIYRERSPIFAVENIRDALAIFHGEIDPVVPRRQSDELAASLKTRGVPFIYHVYPGEGHGFRKPKTIRHFYRTVDKFLRQWVIAK